MSSDDTIRIRRKPGDPPLETGTDWARLDAMTDEEIRAGIAADPEARTLTDTDLQRMRRLVDVKRLRERLGMTQDQFARTYLIPVGTLRDWEQRRKMPDAPARALLWAIEADPEAVAKMLGRRVA